MSTFNNSADAYDEARVCADFVADIQETPNPMKLRRRMFMDKSAWTMVASMYWGWLLARGELRW